MRVMRIDRETWTPAGEVAGITSATVKRSSDAPMLESGELSATGELPEGWYRIDHAGPGGVIHVATLLFAPDGPEWSHGAWSGSYTGRSVLSPASERRVGPGAYAPKGADGAAYAARMLSECIPAPVRADGSFTLSEHVVFDLGSSVLDCAWQVLDAAGWCMQVSGDGTVTVMAKPSEPSLVLGDREAGMLMPRIARSLPVEDVPNVVRAYEGAEMAEAVNDDPASPTSTVSRGRRIEVFEDSPSRVDGESLRAYAVRRLSEESEVYETVDVEREYADGVYPFSVVELSLSAPGLSGTYRVMEQTVECSRGLKVGETLGRRQSWPL